MIRVVGGEWRGRRLKVPQSAAVRPTADRVREAIFNLLGQRLDGDRVLDLFAGTGALGIEALSRGAAHATFVERSPRVARTLGDNLRSLGGEGLAQIVVQAAEVFVVKCDCLPYDVVLADPPYAAPPAATLWQEVLRRLVAPGGRLVIEHAAGSRIEVSAAAVDSRRYGDTAVTLLTAPRHDRRGAET